MFTKRMALHEGGHGHEGCCGQHSHEHAHEHVSGHHHEHGDTPELTPEQTLALMSYMLDHNRHHADELHDICHALEDAGKTEAAAALAEALHEYDHGNSKLEKPSSLPSRTNG